MVVCDGSCFFKLSNDNAKLLCSGFTKVWIEMHLLACPSTFMSYKNSNKTDTEIRFKVKSKKPPGQLQSLYLN